MKMNIYRTALASGIAEHSLASSEKAARKMWTELLVEIGLILGLNRSEKRGLLYPGLKLEEGVLLTGRVLQGNREANLLCDFIGHNADQCPIPPQ